MAVPSWSLTARCWLTPSARYAVHAARQTANVRQQQMYAVSTAVVILSGIVAGGIVGTVMGFSIASHKDVMSKFTPTTQNRLIRWLARPTRDLNFGEGVLFVLLILTWLVVFFVLCGVPFVVAGKLQEGDSTLQAVAMATLLIAWYVGDRLGRRLWSRVF